MSGTAVPRTYFWAYDIFGYLLPGSMFLAGLTAGNEWVGTRVEASWDSGRALDIAALTLAAYVAGHVVAAMSSFLFEKVLLSRVFGYPTHHMFNGPSRGLWFPTYFRPYTDQFRNRFATLFRQRFELEPSDDHDRFWVTWSFISLHHPVAYRRATHFLELYGFTRNLSMVLVLLVPLPWLGAWSGVAQPLIWTLVLVIAASLMLINYTKLLRRLNDEIYRAFVACDGDVGTQPAEAEGLGE